MDHPVRRPTTSIRIVLPERRSSDSGVVDGMIEAEIPSAGHRLEKVGATEVTLLLDSRRATLFVSCRNDHGVAAGVAQVLSANGVRVIDSEQYTGTETAHLQVVIGPSLGDGGYGLVDVSAEEPWASLRQRV